MGAQYSVAIARKAAWDGRLSISGSNRMSNGLWRRLVENTIGHCQADVLLELRWICSAPFRQGKIIDFSRLWDEITGTKSGIVEWQIYLMELIQCSWQK